MTNDDLLFRHRLQLFARAGQVGVSRACRELGYHRSWYYRWKPVVESQGLELLRPRERRRPRMPNQLPPWIEERVTAFFPLVEHLGVADEERIADLCAQEIENWRGRGLAQSSLNSPMTAMRKAIKQIPLTPANTWRNTQISWRHTSFLGRSRRRGRWFLGFPGTSSGSIPRMSKIPCRTKTSIKGSWC